ncbi:hypothetical protein BT96DRAFT_947359 [Gymnopus androsaceus JB14]|uniref:Uncharacterized protein n=1 Tax=Gymnopus androsaceus JB14 TaxID=1447944 RepID=A0A6A4GTM3_9AGAR|nr:hypothetical protein BT96DRAFT_947359 [Gymnopus androsaceus JB14]
MPNLTYLNRKQNNASSFESATADAAKSSSPDGRQVRRKRIMNEGFSSSRKPAFQVQGGTKRGRSPFAEASGKSKLSNSEASEDRISDEDNEGVSLAIRSPVPAILKDETKADCQKQRPQRDIAEYASPNMCSLDRTKRNLMIDLSYDCKNSEGYLHFDPKVKSACSRFDDREKSFLFACGLKARRYGKQRPFEVKLSKSLSTTIISIPSLDRDRKSAVQITEEKLALNNLKSDNRYNCSELEDSRSLEPFSTYRQEIVSAQAYGVTTTGTAGTGTYSISIDASDSTAVPISSTGSSNSTTNSDASTGKNGVFIAQVPMTLVGVIELVAVAVAGFN